MSFRCRADCSLINGAGKRLALAGDAGEATSGEVQLTKDNLLLIGGGNLLLEIPINDVRILNAHGVPANERHIQHQSKGLRFVLFFHHEGDAGKFSRILPQLKAKMITQGIKLVGMTGGFSPKFGGAKPKVLPPQADPGNLRDGFKGTVYSKPEPSPTKGDPPAIKPARSTPSPPDQKNQRWPPASQEPDEKKVRYDPADKSRSNSKPVPFTRHKVPPRVAPKPNIQTKSDSLSKNLKQRLIPSVPVSQHIQATSSPEITAPPQGCITQEWDEIRVSIESIVTAFQEAVANGSTEEAVKLAKELAQGKVKLSCSLLSVDGRQPCELNPFMINVRVELHSGESLGIKLQVYSGMTIYALKVKTFLVHNIPLEAQRWIIKRSIKDDNDSLGRIAVGSGTPVFLYLVNPDISKRTAEDSKRRLQYVHDMMRNRGDLPELMMTPQEQELYMNAEADRNQSFERSPPPQSPHGPPQPPRSPQPQRDPQLYWDQPVQQRQRGPSSCAPGNFQHDSRYKTLPAKLTTQTRSSFLRPNDPHLEDYGGDYGQDYDDDVPNGRLELRVPNPKPNHRVPAQSGDAPRPFLPPPPPPAEPKKRTWQDVGWVCSTCTCINPPMVAACRACLSQRPENYKPPAADTYEMDPEEKQRYNEERTNVELLKQLQQEEQEMLLRAQGENRQQLMEAAEQDIIPNDNDFDCPICFTPIEPGEGVRLRECLHEFCKDCLQDHINLSTDAEIKCPNANEEYQCDQVILDREIKQLISDEDYNRYLQRGLNTAEAAARDTFHCKTPNCGGFCFYDDDNNFFRCEVCNHENCLTCKAIHEGQNCKQYQDDLKIKAGNDEAAKQTQNALQEMIKNGEAMNCPQCGIVIQKKTGCDWLQCSMCKTEICWVTKGPRWGPQGRGDTSGGCKCNFRGQKCHPRCGNCH